MPSIKPEVGFKRHSQKPRCHYINNRHFKTVSLATTAIFPAVMPYLGAYFFPNTPNGQPDRETIERVVPELRRHIEVLDKAVANTGCLAGNNFTYADMNLLPILAYLRDARKRCDIGKRKRAHKILRPPQSA
jgi:glutathione S-transferase